LALRELRASRIAKSAKLLAKSRLVDAAKARRMGHAAVIPRRITLTGNTTHMVVASTEGDVLFDGTILAKGDLMCGTVTHQGGETFPMVAQKRSSGYQSQPHAARAR
jgi:hypothetical protein